MDDRVLPRLAGDRVRTHLSTMPAVVLTGARQTGKSTLARSLRPTGRYATLDDLDVRALAERDPDALVGGAGPITLDEVQRAPDLLHAVKRAIDERRERGRYLLTGSANLLLLERVSESLAGRASYLTLWPMTRREQRGEARCGRWDELLASTDEAWPDVLGAGRDEPEDWRALARRGGFPTPSLELPDEHARAIWFDAYVHTYVERDLQALSAITALPDFRRTMRAAALRLGQVLNQSDLARDVAVPQPTVHRWLNLLEASYLIVRLPAFAANRTTRLIKSPKLFWCDVGLALHLSGSSEPSGAHLENVVLHDLLAWRDARPSRAELHHWRTADGREVDLVVETDDALLPIEVKSTVRPRAGDTAGLRAFRAAYPDRTRAGLLLHAGDKTEWLTADVLAVPWWRVL
ncbi:MAG: ATP-binding protein [Trueperaceae bacterium]|nr:MAG: ATP-binding protein [Trueperaceae bacterium]